MNKSTKEVMFSSGKDDWQTPLDLFASLHKRFQFVLDAAANEDNHLLPRWFGQGGEQEDALIAEWPLCEGNIWLNPPYSRGLQYQFIEKATEEMADKYECGHCIVCLLPARTDTKLFHKFLYKKPNVGIQFLEGRLKFGGAQHGAPFPSMLVTLT